MSLALNRSWSVDEFLTWAGSQEERYEFDGLQPVATTGGIANHSRITLNTHSALGSRLRGTPCASFGPDLGIRTIGNAVRFPDALVTWTRFPGTDRLAPNVVTVFEVLSPDSSRRDRIEKVQEYAGVPSIRSYIILEAASVGLTVLQRSQGDAPWTATTLTGEGVLTLPELGIKIPVGAFYDRTDMADTSADGRIN